MACNTSSVAMTNSSKKVELGFVEKVLPWRVRSKFFPSKVGGKPSWLNLKDLPETEELECRNCRKPLVFILQVYAPIADFEVTFHRTLFLFMCLEDKCCRKNSNENLLVLRCQLPRKNNFYSFNPPLEDESSSNNPSAEQYNSLCDVCGCKGIKQCGKCRKRNYCSKEHQTRDWRDGHKNFCIDNGAEQSVGRMKMQNSALLLPEYELVTESEEIPTLPPEKSDSEKMAEYKQFMKSVKACSVVQSTSVDDLECFAKKQDKMFKTFRKRINYEPEQVLRYDREGQPLWVSSRHIASETDIPLCHCGAKRIFEYQVMPQLLNYLSLDKLSQSVDWGILAVYTCSKSCSDGVSYNREFVWKQDFSDADDGNY